MCALQHHVIIINLLVGQLNKESHMAILEFSMGVPDRSQ